MQRVARYSVLRRVRLAAARRIAPVRPALRTQLRSAPAGSTSHAAQLTLDALFGTSVRHSSTAPAPPPPTAAAGGSKAVPGVPYSHLTVGVPAESGEGERRVALVPATVAQLVKKGLRVVVQRGAGAAASFSDADYEAAGAKMVDAKEALAADVVVKVRPPTREEVQGMKKGANVVSFVYPGRNKELLDAMADKGLNVFAMDCVPRISRAQVWRARARVRTHAAASRVTSCSACRMLAGV